MRKAARSAVPTELGRLIPLKILSSDALLPRRSRSGWRRWCRRRGCRRSSCRRGCRGSRCRRSRRLLKRCRRAALHWLTCCPASQEPPEDPQDDERADDRREEAAPVEDIGVADAEPEGEDHVANECTQETRSQGHAPRGRSAHFSEEVARHQHPRDNPRYKAEKNRTYHSNSPSIEGLHAIGHYPPPNFLMTATASAAFPAKQSAHF